MRLFVAVLLLALGGCVAQSVPPEKISTIKSIGIVSAIGDQVTLKTLGIMVFGNAIDVGATDDWGVDDAAERIVRDQLGKRYDVRAIAHDRAAFRSDKPGVPASMPLTAALKSALRLPPGAPGPDAYVVITKSAVPYSLTNQFLYGLGLLQGGFGSTMSYAIFRVTVVDGRDFTVLAQTTAQLPDATPFDSVHGPHELVDSAMWADTVAALKPTQRQAIKAELEKLVSFSLPVALKSLELAN